jgi:hypothetical protein
MLNPGCNYMLLCTTYFCRFFVHLGKTKADKLPLPAHSMTLIFRPDFITHTIYGKIYPYAQPGYRL